MSNFRNPFALGNQIPFLSVLQQNPLHLQQQLLSLASVSGTTPEDDDEGENMGGGEPEDLTLGYKKEKKEDDGHDVTPTGAGQPNWSYEEQFKQLYELSSDQKRKEWLDDWLSFMHRIGKPVTRIPIMAKQVLDLYELYRLVVQHGGLVEIINKKLWREITKGLNLPSSITSAAFTLRTQYQKYLYDYECEKEGLSNPADLQAAIDGNRREGRRNTGAPSFGHPLYPLGPSGGPASLLGKHPLDFLDDDSGLAPQNPFMAAYRAEQQLIIEAQQRQLQNEFRAAAEAMARQNLGLGALGLQGNPLGNNGRPSGRESTSSVDSEHQAKKARISHPDEGAPSATVTASTPQPLPATNIKINNSTEGDKKSMVVSIELDGTTYHGVLFANAPVTTE
ncbi:unnamed protein product, partial [Mesorhabditis spiculigera]